MAASPPACRPAAYARRRSGQTYLALAREGDGDGRAVPRCVDGELRRYLECSIQAYGFLTLRCGECSHYNLLAFSCKRLGSCPSWGARRMPQAAARLVDHVIPHMPARQWVLSLSIPLRLLLAAQPELITPVLQMVQRVIAPYSLGQAGLKAEDGHGGAVALVQRFGSAATLNVHLNCLVLDGVYRCRADGAPSFVEVSEATDDELDGLLQTAFTRLIRSCSRARACWSRRGARPTRPGPMLKGMRRAIRGRCRRRPSRTASPSGPAPDTRC